MSVNEMDIFGFMYEKYKLPETVKLFEAFSGIGCQRMAFDRLGIKYEMVGFSEIDKYAIQAYNAIHGDTKNYGNICDINGADLPEIDVFTYSFPCTDISKSGKQKGLKDTRSGLVYEVLRILQQLNDLNRLPKVLIMENVVDLVQTKFIRQFQEIQLELEQLGYTNYTQTINAKNYGVAQNRDRVFMVSILGEYSYEFPKPIPLEKRLKDYLEDDVDEKYIPRKVILEKIRNNKLFEYESYIQFEWKGHFEQMCRVWKTIMPTLHTKSADILILDKKENYRHPTELECFRLMDIDDELFYKAQDSGISNAQLYKMAGNGIVVAVFAAIIDKLR